jgi:hypothetical protein
MGDSEVASFVGDRMKRADVPLLSVEGKLHFMPTQITQSATASKMPAGMHHSE